METQQLQGVAGLKKHDIKVSGIVFMLYCLVAAGAFGIEEMIPESGPGMTLLLLCIFPIIWALPISSLVALTYVLPTLGGLASLPAGSWENWLAICGAICIILGIVLFLVGRKKDAPLPEKKLDVGEVLNKYLMEEKTETFFD